MKLLIIAGDGPNLEEELREVEAFGLQYDLMVLNRASRRVAPRKFKWLATCHPDVFREPQADHPYLLVGPMPCADREWDSPWHTGGGSAMYATLLGLEGLGFDRIILCGCPLETGDYLYNFEADRIWVERARVVFRGRVRSMSGNTRMLLGSPDAEWLACVTKAEQPS